MFVKIYDIRDITLSECYHLNKFYDIDVIYKDGAVMLVQSEKNNW